MNELAACTTRRPAGFVTSGLELWQGEECASSYFRQRLWGTLSMAQTLLADRACWMRHMKLDPVTGVEIASSAKDSSLHIAQLAARFTRLTPALRHVCTLQYTRLVFPLALFAYSWWKLSTPLGTFHPADLLAELLRDTLSNGRPGQ